MKTLEEAWAQFPQMSNNLWITTSLQRVSDAVQDVIRVVHVESCDVCFSYDKIDEKCVVWKEINERIARVAFEEGLKEGRRMQELKPETHVS